MEASTEIAVPFDEQNQGIPFDAQRNRLCVQQLRSSNSIATLTGSIDADNGSFFEIPKNQLDSRDDMSSNRPINCEEE